MLLSQVVSDPTSLTWWAEHFGVFGVVLFLGTPIFWKILIWVKNFLEDIKSAHIRYLGETSGTIVSNTQSLKTLADANISEIKLMQAIADTQREHTTKLDAIPEKFKALLTH